MGCVLGASAACQCLPARCRREGKCTEGSEHWRSVPLLQREQDRALTCDAEGELIDMIEEFSDGRIQFAYVKVKDPNSGLPKNALIGWCGEGVPERTKGYFTSHVAAVSKLLHV